MILTFTIDSCKIELTIYEGDQNMYTKPIVYKVYAIIMAICGVLAVGGMIVAFIRSASCIFSPFTFMSVLQIICFLLFLLIACWFTYVEFAAMFTFAGMIEHEMKDDGTVFKKKIKLSGKAYRLSGSLVFYFVLIISMVASIVLTVIDSVEHGVFVVVPVLPMIVMAVAVFFAYVIDNCRFGAFGAVLDIKEIEDPRVTEQNRLLETNPNTLRAFCRILFGLAALTLVGVVIALFTAVDPIMALTGIKSKALLIAALICGGIIGIIEMAIMGCFFDNLAKMQEKYLIKYNLI